MLLTIGMMVKNEEKNLEKCLKSLTPILKNLDSELIIVDTGSDDNTVEISKKYTDKVYFHKWNNDFSEMRNITISYAKGEWFFVIDGDEELESTEEIIKFFKTGEYKNYYTASINVKNYESTKDLNKYGELESVRIFKNDGYFKYEGVVHNQPLYKHPIKKIDCNINHYGYVSDDHELMEKKFKRTATLLKKELEKDPKNIYYRYQLAVSYSMHNDFVESLNIMSQLYKSLTEKEKRENKYILSDYATILLKNNKFRECEEMCKRELNLSSEDEVYKIDLFFFLAKSQFAQGEFSWAKKNYENHIRLLKRLKTGKLSSDVTVKLQTGGYNDLLYYDLSIINYKNENYEETLNNILQIKNVKAVSNLFSNLINSYINIKKYDELIDYYENVIMVEYTLDFINKFECEVENIKLKKEEIANVLESKFSLIKTESLYRDLNALRIINNTTERKKLFDMIIQSADLNDAEYYYGDLIYIGIKNNYDIRGLLEKLKYDKIYIYFEYCNQKYADFKDELFKLVITNKIEKTKFVDNKINTIVYKFLLSLSDFNKEDSKNIFEKYIENGEKLIKEIYLESLLESENIRELRNDEYEFFAYMMKVKQWKDSNKKRCIEYLRKALKAYPCMKEWIKVLIDQMKEELNPQNEINKLKKLLIDNINKLLENNNLTEAKQVIAEYKQYSNDDSEIHSIEAVICIMENNIDEAVVILNKAIEKDKRNFDCLYNLAYCYEVSGDIKNAIRYYRKAWFYLENDVSEKDILIKLYSLEYNCDDDEELQSIYEYYNQLKQYILMRLSGNNKVKYEDVVTEKKPILKRKMKVMFGSMEIANQMNTYSVGLNEKDVDSYTLNEYESYLQYDSDFYINSQNINEKQLNKLALLIAEFDIFHLFFGTSLLSDYSDLEVMRELNKKVVMNYWGSDVRMKSIAEKSNKYVQVKCEDENLIKNNIKYISKYIDTCIVADVELYQYVAPYFKNVEFLSAGIILDMENNKCNEVTIKEKKDEIVIVHAPTSKAIKGSEYIIKAIGNLKNKYDIDFKLVENLSNREAKEVYKTADIIVDQILGGTYGIFAIEAMSIGKPVITYIADAYREGYSDELPIISANPDNIEKVLEELINNMEYTRLVGEKGIEYVKKYHDASVIADKLIEIYNRI